MLYPRLPFAALVLPPLALSPLNVACSHVSRITSFSLSPPVPFPHQLNLGSRETSNHPQSGHILPLDSLSRRNPEDHNVFQPFSGFPYTLFLLL